MHEVINGLLNLSGSIVPIEKPERRINDKQGIQGWHQYQTKAPTKDNVESWLAEGYTEFGLIMGYGSFHVIDIDTKNHPQPNPDEFFRQIWFDIPINLKAKLTVQSTRNKGNHIIYKCDVPAAHENLMVNPETRKPIIETIGSRNYILIYPSAGYSVVSGSLSNVQEITKEEHEWLLDHCRKVGGSEADLFPVKVPVTINYQDSKPSSAWNISDSNHFISETADYLDSNGIDITSNYQDWVRIALVCANELGVEGRESFHKISKSYPGYDERECDALYTGVLKKPSQSHLGKKVTGATLQHILKDYGIEMTKQPKTPKPNKKIAQRTEYAISFIQSKDLKRNLFTKKVEKSNGLAITDGDIDSYYIELRKSGQSVIKSDVISILNTENIPSYDPLQDWLDEAEQKADDHAVQELMGCFEFKTQDPAERAFCKRMILKWLIQIAAVISDGRMPRLVLVLLGETNIGKTEFFRRLLPPLFSKKYYTESALDREKDSDILMCEYLIINIDELAGIVKYAKTLERFKSLVSAPSFALRVPYGKVTEQFQRKAVLCGTSNKIDVIQDHDAGNSRIIPVELISINWERFNKIDKEALFGSISIQYKADKKGSITLSTEELETLKSLSGNYTTVNVEQELIQRFFQPGNEFMTVSEICSHLSEYSKMQVSVNYVSRELTKLGYKKERKRSSGSNSALNGYYVNFSGSDLTKHKQVENPIDKLRNELNL